MPVPGTRPRFERDDYYRVLQVHPDAHPEIEAVSHALSITTFRYIPPGADRASTDQSALNTLNERVLDVLQQSGRAYVSNALVDGRFVLRACIVNFRTERPDLEALVEAVVDIGRDVSGAR